MLEAIRTRRGLGSHLPAKAKDTLLLAKAGNLGSRALVFDDTEVRQLLRAAVERVGSQLAFARLHHVDRTHLNQILRGRAGISRSVLKSLGLANVYTIERREPAKSEGGAGSHTRG